VALGTTEEMRSSTQPRVRQFLDRIPEPEISGELDYLQMLTAERPNAHSAAGKRG
jgi:phospholipid/cholesterol/gamma-HCH transport system ATP-binding protein